MRYLVIQAFTAPIAPELDDDRGLVNNTSRPDAPRSVWVRAPVEFWDAVDARAKRMGESRSEAIRTLVEAGMAICEGGVGHG